VAIMMVNIKCVFGIMVSKSMPLMNFLRAEYKHLNVNNLRPKPNAVNEDV
jgi:hypothetical protein